MAASHLLIGAIVCFVSFPQDGRGQAAAKGSVPDSIEASLAGAAAGQSKSTVAASFASGGTSFALPGSGLIYLLFLKTGEVEPNFAEQAQLRDKSVQYIATWTQAYDRALTKKQRNAILIGTAVGSIVGYLLIWKPIIGLNSF